RVKSRLDGHRLPFFGIDHRFEPEVMINRLPATFMHVARGGPDLRVLIRRNVLGDEIYQPPVALQQGEHLYGSIRRLGRWSRSLRLRGPFKSRHGSRQLRDQLRSDLVRNFSSSKNREETSKGV